RSTVSGARTQPPMGSSCTDDGWLVGDRSCSDDLASSLVVRTRFDEHPSACNNRRKRSMLLELGHVVSLLNRHTLVLQPHSFQSTKRSFNRGSGVHDVRNARPPKQEVQDLFRRGRSFLQTTRLP